MISSLWLFISLPSFELSVKRYKIIHKIKITIAGAYDMLHLEGVLDNREWGHLCRQGSVIFTDQSNALVRSIQATIGSSNTHQHIQKRGVDPGQ
jgi:hypothetical protein